MEAIKRFLQSKGSGALLILTVSKGWKYTYSYTMATNQSVRKCVFPEVCSVRVSLHIAVRHHMCLHIDACMWAGPITVETRETQLSYAGIHPGWIIFQTPRTASTRSPLTLLGAQTAAYRETPTDWSSCLKTGIWDTQGCKRHLHRAGSYNTRSMGGLSSSALVVESQAAPFVCAQPAELPPFPCKHLL